MAMVVNINVSVVRLQVLVYKVLCHDASKDVDDSPRLVIDLQKIIPSSLADQSNWPSTASLVIWNKQYSLGVQI